MTFSVLGPFLPAYISGRFGSTSTQVENVGRTTLIIFLTVSAQCRRDESGCVLRALVRVVSVAGMWWCFHRDLLVECIYAHINHASRPAWNIIRRIYKHTQELYNFW